MFAALAEFERGVIRERTQAGLLAALARGRHGGAPLQAASERSGPDRRHGLVNFFVRSYHTVYNSDDRTARCPDAGIGVPVISRQSWNLWAMS